jgi:hypothetical protein
MNVKFAQNRGCLSRAGFQCKPHSSRGSRHFTQIRGNRNHHYSTWISARFSDFRTRIYLHTASWSPCNHALWATLVVRYTGWRVGKRCIDAFMSGISFKILQVHLIRQDAMVGWKNRTYKQSGYQQARGSILRSSLGDRWKCWRQTREALRRKRIQASFCRRNAIWKGFVEGLE